MDRQLFIIAESFISKMFDWASRCPEFAVGAAELETYVLGQTTYREDGHAIENGPQDLYQLVSLPAGFSETTEEEEELILQYLADVWPSLWREAAGA